jgi:serine/threonine-protein kinase
VTNPSEATLAKAAVVGETASTSSLDIPIHLVRRAVRRIRYVAVISIVIQLVLWFLVNLLEGQIAGDLRRPLQWIPNVTIIVSSLAILYLSHRDRMAPRQVVTLGLGYQVIVSYAIVMSQYWDQFAGFPIELINSDILGVSPVAIWMMFYTVLVPARPSRALFALLGSATAVPATYLLMVQYNGAPAIGASTFIAVLVVPYLTVALFAYITAQIVHRLGQDVHRAQEMGSYRLTERLGTGGMGEVWRANHRMLARPAAVKLIRAEALGADVTEDEVVKARFEREAQVTASLQSPHTVELYDFGITDDGAFYYVMELLHGRDLSALVKQFGPLPAERVIHILRQACASLAEAHTYGLVHRDIKPANLYLCRRAFAYDFVKILDFGLVKHRADTGEQQVDLSQTGIVPGTPSFMAPEMIFGEKGVDGRADLYALGCVAYWLLTGRPVFEGSSVGALLVAHAERQPDPPSEHTELPIPPALEQLVLECLEKSPDDRPQSAEALGTQLTSVDVSERWTPGRAAEWWAQNDPEAFPPDPVMVS